MPPIKSPTAYMRDVLKKQYARAGEGDGATAPNDAPASTSSRRRKRSSSNRICSSSANAWPMPTGCLQSKPTKLATESKRIANGQVATLLGCFGDLRRTDLVDSDSRTVLLGP